MPQDRITLVIKYEKKILMLEEIHHMDDNYNQCATSENKDHLYII